MKKLILLLLMLCCFISCTSLRNNEFAKRKYMPRFQKEHTEMTEINSKQSGENSINDETVLYADNANKKENQINQVGSNANNHAIIHNNNFLLQRKHLFEDCDEIILKNGESIKAKITDIGITEIKYKKCDNLSGPSISILKANIFMIKYANGTKDVFKEENANNENTGKSNGNISGKESNGMANASVVMGVLSFFIFPLIGAILALVFGGIAKSQIKENPKKYSKSAYKNAKTGLTLGTISLLLILALILIILVL